MIWSSNLDKALTLLAQRIDEDFSFWYKEEQDDMYFTINSKITCRICGYCADLYHAQQSQSDLIRHIRRHGLGHLKENNLLPFI